MAVKPELTTQADGKAARLDPDGRYFNRHLSWLAYNARVLALAEQEDLPLLERVRFLAIFSTNLDEFFQVRVAGLHDQILAGMLTVAPDGRTPQDQLVAVRK